MLGSDRVESRQLSLVLAWKISPKDPNFFIFASSGHKKSHRAGSKSTRVKARSAPYLLQVKSMLESGQGPSLICTEQEITFFHVSGKPKQDLCSVDEL